MNFSLLVSCRVGHHLAQWLIDYKIIEHIFGPNLHVEVSDIVKHLEVHQTYISGLHDRANRFIS